MHAYHDRYRPGRPGRAQAAAVDRAKVLGSLGVRAAGRRAGGGPGTSSEPGQLAVRTAGCIARHRRSRRAVGCAGRKLMSATVDANILVYASNEGAAEFSRAQELVGNLLAGPSLTTLFWPVLLSYLRIVTHPRIFGRPLHPEKAMVAIDQVLASTSVQVVGEGTTFWAAYRSLDIGLAIRGAVSYTHLTLPTKRIV